MRGKSLPVGTLSGNKAVQFYTEDEGATCTGFGMGSLLLRDEVDKRLPDAREECRIGVGQEICVLGLAFRNGVNTISGAVGIDFQPPVPMETAIHLAACLTRDSIVADASIFQPNKETGIRYTASFVRGVSL